MIPEDQRVESILEADKHGETVLDISLSISHSLYSCNTIKSILETCSRQKDKLQAALESTLIKAIGKVDERTINDDSRFCIDTLCNIEGEFKLSQQTLNKAIEQAKRVNKAEIVKQLENQLLKQQPPITQNAPSILITGSRDTLFGSSGKDEAHLKSMPSKVSKSYNGCTLL